MQKACIVAGAGIVSGCRGVGVRNVARLWTIPVLRAQPPKWRRRPSQHRNGPPFRLALAPCKRRAYNCALTKGGRCKPVPLCAVKGLCPSLKRARVRLIMRQDMATSERFLRLYPRPRPRPPPLWVGCTMAGGRLHRPTAKRSRPNPAPRLRHSGQRSGQLVGSRSRQLVGPPTCPGGSALLGWGRAHSRPALWWGGLLVRKGAC